MTVFLFPEAFFVLQDGHIGCAQTIDCPVTPLLVLHAEKKLFPPVQEQFSFCYPSVKKLFLPVQEQFSFYHLSAKKAVPACAGAAFF